MAKKPATLAAVTNIRIEDQVDALRVSWDPVEGVKKYAVRLLAYYDLDGGRGRGW